MQIGTANYNSESTKEYKKRNFFKLKIGDNYYRVLPPCFSLAEKGEWAKFYSVHFGYKGSPNKNGTAPYRPFACPRRVDRNKKVLVPCAEHDEVEKVLKSYTDRQKQLESEGVPVEEIRARLEPLSKYLKDHNLARKWHLNVIDDSGNMGCLKVPHTAYLDLKDTIQKVIEKYGVDPLSVEGGLQFNFKRTGVKFNETKYKVEVVMEMVTTPQGRFEKPKSMPLSASDVNKMETDCFDLSTMYTALTPEEVEMLVSTSGDPAIVDKVFAKSNKTFEDNTDNPDDSVDDAGPAVTSPVQGSSGGQMSKERFQTLFGG